MKRYQVNSVELSEEICYGEYDSYDEAYEEYVKLGGLEDETLSIDEIDDMALEEEE